MISLTADPAVPVYAARALRDFADAYVVILLPLHLIALGLGSTEVGVLATTALLGSAATTIAVGQIGSRFDPRTLLLLASGLMTATGLALALASNYQLLLVVAFLGTVNPTAGNVSIFVPLEHAVVTRLASDAARTSSFSRYSLAGATAGALGSLAASSPDLAAVIGSSKATIVGFLFLLYAALGLAAGGLYTLLPRTVPGEFKTAQAGLGPSRSIVYRLAGLFSVDAFAGGFAVQSLLSLWLFQKFHLSLWTAGLFFFWSGVAAAFSFPAATWLSKRIGLVHTMVWTHIPSSVFLIGAAVSPRLDWTLGLLVMRAALSQMDVPARSSYVMAVVTPPERAAAASLTMVPRSLASALSPAIAGVLLASSFPALPLILCGLLKIAYDLALLWTFRRVRPPEEH